MDANIVYLLVSSINISQEAGILQKSIRIIYENIYSLLISTSNIRHLAVRNKEIYLDSNGTFLRGCYIKIEVGRRE